MPGVSQNDCLAGRESGARAAPRLALRLIIIIINTIIIINNTIIIIIFAQGTSFPRDLEISKV